MKQTSILILCLLAFTTSVQGQGVTPYITHPVDSNGKFLFYLHGGVVQQQGAKAVSAYYGAYDYHGILDTLASEGFHVVSEVRPKESTEAEYANKVAAQVDSLLDHGVSPVNISVVGASLGAYIAVEVSYMLKNDRINYALLGLCSDYALDYFSKYKGKLYGNFLSIYEKTDDKGSCRPIFDKLPLNKKFIEIELRMGNSHAFLFKPYREWTEPLVNWINESNKD